MLIDTHCHLTHERFDEDRDQVLATAGEAGVGAVLTVASELDDAEGIADLLEERHPGGGSERGGGVELFGTAGVHPHEAAKAPANLRVRLQEALDRHPRVVAVGECGLDYHYDFSPRPVQRRVFATHLEVAGERDLPAVVHCREAEEEMLPIVREAGVAGIRGVLHCFPGHMALLEAAMEAGWCVSFTGNVTFKSFDGVAAVRAVPADRYFLETDGPYMAPIPHRGKRNEPRFVPLIRDRIAAFRDEPPEVVEADTTTTARAFFALPL